MFLTILDMLFGVIESVIDALKVDLFTVGSVSISFWELLLGMFTVGLLFSFFLKSRPGSGVDVARKIDKYERAQERSSAGRKGN